MYKSLAVFCGSKSGNDPLYEEHAVFLGELMAKNNIQLVYGGGNKGLMGAVANAVLKHGGEVIGVIPEVLLQWESQHTGLTVLHTVADMHVRKKMMYELADAAIILPGGHGTLDEMFEMITWNNLSIHDKKIILLNTAGYYNSLMQHITNMYQQGFLYKDWREGIEVYNTPDAIFDALLNKS
ncbi:TIGR00730 family Rossman fold protein [Foetidibacter luteolus]|uniref:LOG family protein n=1 Tax=Foetidibacter luteolus TaxID=2608880 RepID=UPI00129B3F8B|nr:TIGR00730 family Rossman fold protein [Foetidibacter luteolus]